MEIDNKEKYQVSGALLNKLLFDARKATLRQIELADVQLVKNCSIPDVGQSLPDAEQCLKIQEQVKQYCYTDQDDKPVISSGGIRTIISRWKQMIV